VTNITVILVDTSRWQLSQSGYS